MKFTLTYDGELASSGNSPKPDEVWRMRKAFHPQLEELWQSHKVLRNVRHEAVVPEKGEFEWYEWHHSDTGVQAEIAARVHPMPVRRLCDPIKVQDRSFLPIVRESMALTCSLDILFLSF